MIPDYATYTTLINSPYQEIQQQKISVTTVQGRTYSLWASAQDAGTIPTASSGIYNSSPGALDLVDSTKYGQQWLARNSLDMGNPGALILADRLVANGGMSGTVVGSQFTNLPTPATPPRYASGSGVMAAIEIYTQIGATGTTMVVSGLNELGVTIGSPAFTIGGTGFREASRFIIVPLPAGSYGWRRITSVRFIATTGTAGNFGVTLFKPLGLYFDYSPGIQYVYDPIVGGGQVMSSVPNGSALFYIVMSNAISSGALTIRHVFIEG